jgi:hypothetical protein
MGWEQEPALSAGVHTCHAPDCMNLVPMLLTWHTSHTFSQAFCLSCLFVLKQYCKLWRSLMPSKFITDSFLEDYWPVLNVAHGMIEIYTECMHVLFPLLRSAGPCL